MHLSIFPFYFLFFCRHIALIDLNEDCFCDYELYILKDNRFLFYNRFHKGTLYKIQKRNLANLHMYSNLQSSDVANLLLLPKAKTSVL